MINLTRDFLKLLINTIPLPLFFKDVKGRYQGCNDAFADLMGRSREEIVGRTVFDLAPPEVAESYHKNDQDLFRAPGTQNYESQVHLPDGSIRDVIFWKGTYQDETDHVAGLVGVMADVTDRRRIEMSLREALDLKQKLVEASPLGISAYEAKTGQCVLANQGLANIVGTTQEQLLAQNFREIASWKASGLLEVAERCTAPSCLDQTLASGGLLAEPVLAGFIG